MYLSLQVLGLTSSYLLLIEHSPSSLYGSSFQGAATSVLLLSGMLVGVLIWTQVGSRHDLQYFAGSLLTTLPT